MKNGLAKLERINLREAWKHEAHEFTPWLATQDNLDMLADALGLEELELVQTEYPVGDFSLDILCSDDAGRVIIENQLAKTDHSHLGQILTYAAGVGAKKVIWIAESFRPEHVAAFEFLNQNTTGDLNFFAVEIELWRIADSPMAPSFNVVVKPNDWAKTGREGARAAEAGTPTKQLQLKFWTEWNNWLEAKQSQVKPQKASPQHWINIALGRAGIHAVATINSREDRIGVEVYITHKNSKSFFQQLQQRKEDIETQLGFQMDWQELPDSHASRIAIYRTESALDIEADWPTYFDWLESKTQRIANVFRPIIRELV